jgi:hypothetical protein
MESLRPEIFREAAGQSGRLTLGELLRLHGDASSAVLLLVLALLCVVPVYGVGTALSVAILAMAWRWHRQERQDAEEIAGAGGAGETAHPPLAGRLANLSLDETWSRRCLHGLAWLYGTAGRTLRARWSFLRHRSTHGWWSLWIAAMGFLIFLPLPLGNVLPSLSLVLMSLGWMFRDGLALLLSKAVGVGAMAFAWISAQLLAEMLSAGWAWLGRWF